VPFAKVQKGPHGHHAPAFHWFANHFHDQFRKVRKFSKWSCSASPPLPVLAQAFWVLFFVFIELPLFWKTYPCFWV